MLICLFLRETKYCPDKYVVVALNSFRSHFYEWILGVSNHRRNNINFFHSLHLSNQVDDDYKCSLLQSINLLWVIEKYLEFIEQYSAI